MQASTSPCSCSGCSTAAIPATELAALALAVGNSVGRPHEYALVALLRRLDPSNAVLATMDRISREHGYVSAGTDERLPLESWLGADLGAAP